MVATMKVVSNEMPSRRGSVSDAEWEARVNLAALYRLVAHYGMTDQLGTHISHRLPDAPDQFLINPYGWFFEEITASSLVKMDYEGNVLQDEPNEFNEAGFNIHSCILKARPDVTCALHTHTPAGLAVSAQKCGLMPITQTALRFYGTIGYHDYEGIADDADEQARLVRDLGSNQALMMRNHGLLTAGRSPAEAWILIHDLEKACQSQLQAMAGGIDNIVVPSKDVCGRTAAQYKAYYGNKPAGERAWPALLRQLDRIDTSYRH